MSGVVDPIFNNRALDIAIRVLTSTYGEKKFDSLPLAWSQFLAAIVIRKRSVGNKGTTVFANEFAGIITPEKEARISELLSYINESVVVVRTDSSVAAVEVESNKMQYIYSGHVIDIDIDSTGNRTSKTHNLPISFVRELIATI